MLTGYRQATVGRTGLVFTTRHGTPIEPWNSNRSFDRCIPCRPGAADHRARHSQDLCLAAGRPSTSTRAWRCILRHSKIAVTMEIYTEAPSDATRDALRRLGDWLG